MKFNFTLLLIFLATLSFGQEKKSTFQRKYNPKPDIQIAPLPVFPGDISEYIKENIHYPQKAYENKIDGRVIVNYVIQADGYVSKIKVKEGIGYGCDEEAVRVLENMPRWTPGQQKGKNINYSNTLKVYFDYPEEDLSSMPNSGSVFPGDLGKFLRNNMVFPYKAMRYEARGEVLITFIIDKYGYVSKVELLKDIGYGVDEAVYKLIRKMPRWKPAITDGKKVSSRYSITIDCR